MAIGRHLPVQFRSMGLCCVKQRRDLEEAIQDALTNRPISGENKSRAALATFGGGRFWTLEAAFKLVNGVSKVVSGYMGGIINDPTYESVMTGRTSFALVVQITFDENIVQYPELVHFFLRLHDPTQVNGQGEDVGNQFRSIIFYHSEDQDRVASLIKISLNKQHVFPSPIVMQIVPAIKFYEAEPAQHNYYETHLLDPYCSQVITPKLSKFRKMWKSNMKTKEEDEFTIVGMRGGKHKVSRHHAEREWNRGVKSGNSRDAPLN